MYYYNVDFQFSLLTFPVLFANIIFYGFAGELPDSAALCATDPTSEVQGNEVQCKTSHGHCSVPGIIKPAAVSFALFDNWHCCGSMLLYQLPFLTSVLTIKCLHKRHVVLACNTGRSKNAIYPRAFPGSLLFAFSVVLILIVLYNTCRMRCSDSDKLWVDLLGHGSGSFLAYLRENSYIKGKRRMHWVHCLVCRLLLPQFGYSGFSCSYSSNSISVHNHQCLLSVGLILVSDSEFQAHPSVMRQGLRP